MRHHVSSISARSAGLAVRGRAAAGALGLLAAACLMLATTVIGAVEIGLHVGEALR